MLQWLALGGLQMLHVEQYLRHMRLLQDEGQQPMALQDCHLHRTCLYVNLHVGQGEEAREAVLTSPNDPLVAASSTALCHRTTSAQPFTSWPCLIETSQHGDDTCGVPMVQAPHREEKTTYPTSPSDSAPCLRNLRLGRPEWL